METKKEEKKAEYETIGQLMKSLIERGWLPRGDKEIVRAVYDVRHKMIGLYEDDGKEYFELVSKKSLREFVGIDSGLWQFVCENGMVKEGHKHERILDPTFGEGWADCKRQEHDGNYGYRLIESALKDESELEDFLLQNIKID